MYFESGLEQDFKHSHMNNFSIGSFSFEWFRNLTLFEEIFERTP